MNVSHLRLAALILASLLTLSGASQAAEPETVSTAPLATTGAPPAAAQSVGDQIDTYLKTSPARALPEDAASGVTSGDEPRKVHGVVDVAVGSNGYRSVFVQSDVPVGKTGTLSIAVGQTRFNGRGYDGAYGGGAYDGRYGSGDRQSLALGLSLGGDAALDPRDRRCRQTGDDASDLRPDRQFEGARARPCRPAGTAYAPR